MRRETLGNKVTRKKMRAKPNMDTRMQMKPRDAYKLSQPGYRRTRMVRTQHGETAPSAYPIARVLRKVKRERYPNRRFLYIPIFRFVEVYTAPVTDFFKQWVGFMAGHSAQLEKDELQPTLH